MAPAPVQATTAAPPPLDLIRLLTSGLQADTRVQAGMDVQPARQDCAREARRGPRGWAILGMPPSNRVYDVHILGAESFCLSQSRDTSYEMGPCESVWKNGQELLSTRDFVDTVLWPALWSCSIGDTGVRIDVAAGGHMCLMTGCNRMGVACDCYVATLRRNPEQRPEREACRPEQQLDRADRRTGPMQRTDRGSPYSRRR